MQAISTKRTRQPPSVRGGSEDSAREVTELLALEVAALREKWAKLFGVHPSPCLGRLLMVRAIAHRFQERAFGGLKPSVQRLLNRVCEGRTEVGLEHMPQNRPMAGTVLIREGRGVSHRVTVLDTDVVYRGRRYRSLSEVARAIAGSRWSGPLFFGLKHRAKDAANG